MHRIQATPGGWNPSMEGVIFIEQNPAPIVFITSADTDIQTLASCVDNLPCNFPDIRVVNLLQLQQELTIDNYGEEILVHAQVIILRLLGGRSYWSYGLEVCEEIAQQYHINLFVLPGEDRPSPELFSHSNLPLSQVTRLWQYLTEGGVNNFINGLKFISDICFHTNFNPCSPQTIPRLGVYLPQDNSNFSNNNNSSIAKISQKFDSAIVFYRSHYLSGNVKAISALWQGLKDKNLTAIAIYVSSLKELDIQEELIKILQDYQVKIILNTTSFSVAQIGAETETKIWQTLDIPVLQVILSGSDREYWENNFQGLYPKDVAMNVALPEVDGRIITRAISFKSVETWHPRLETNIVTYQPLDNRINYVTELAKNWAKLKDIPNGEKKVALILANYPNKDGRIANGVGLDTPASCIKILEALQENGYYVNDIPQDGDELIFSLIKGVTNDIEMQSQRQVNQFLSLSQYYTYFNSLPLQVKTAISERWGDFEQFFSLLPPQEKVNNSLFNNSSDNANDHKSTDKVTNNSVNSDHNLGEKIIPISGISLGNVFIGVQPSRGYDLDPSLNYHAPDLEPTHYYLGFYYWLREIFQADVIIHVGKHGNLEWLPGKSLVLSENCYPEITIGTIPHFYPFIVNDPGEGTQAKRRANAVILDHLTPPLTRAELYGELIQLEGLIDEYYQALSLNPTGLKTICDRTINLINQTNLHEDLAFKEVNKDTLREFLTVADTYLCELKEAQIRDGLHIFGQCPEGNQLRDLICAIARFSSYGNLGLMESIREDLEKNISHHKIYQDKKDKDKQEYIENLGSALVEKLLMGENYQIISLGKNTEKSLEWIAENLIPKLRRTNSEINNLIRGLAGKFIPSGASGAPTRGRSDVLPTGRNFYSVDVRAIPSETAWDVGRKAANALIERYTQENGEYPRTLAISVWGTSTMRTGGDDIAQIMALMGVKPVWDGITRRVVDFEIIPISLLGRPRVDVTVRVSGLFRDTFPNIMELIYKINQHLSTLAEEKENNPLAMQVKKETEYWINQGLEEDQALERATYRLFSSKPGAYGAGLQGLIEAQNWETDEDLARAYLNWSSYAYQGTKGLAQPEVFQQRLQNLQIVLQNQDNREHDLLDSDDYYQFQGGLTAAVRHLTGQNPTIYFGDNSQPNNPKVRHLKEEIARVFRSRVINPKWIAGVMRHGYKGAFEMSATVDFLFAYSATTKTVPDFMFKTIAENYLFQEEVREFIQQKNPWALRDISERLIEAHQRGLWQNVDNKILDKLVGISHEAELEIEIKNDISSTQKIKGKVF